MNKNLVRFVTALFGVAVMAKILSSRKTCLCLGPLCACSNR